MCCVLIQCGRMRDALGGGRLPDGGVSIGYLDMLKDTL